MKKIFFIAGWFVLSNGLLAQQKLTLSDIRDSIVQHHPLLKVADASQKAMDAAAEGAWSWMAPEIGAGFFETPYNPGKWKGTDMMQGMGMFMVSAEQMFPNKKAQQANYDYLKSKGAIEQEKKAGWLNELMSQARDAYYDLIVIEKRKELLNQNKKLIDFMIQSAEIRYRNNLGTLNSYYKLKAANTKIETEELVLQAKAIQQQSVINNLLMKETDSPFDIDTLFRWYPFEQLAYADTVLPATSEYRIMERTIQTNQLERESEMTSLKPQFGLRYEHMAGFGHQPQMFSLMAMMRIPIAKWSSRANKAKAESLLYQNETLRVQQSAYLIQQKGKYTALIAALNGVKKEMKMYEEEVIPALQKNFQTIQISYEQNKTELFELFDAWQSLLDAKMEVLEAQERGMGIQSELFGVFQIEEESWRY